ncbi:GEVED domain-containing protein [Soonwooa sp.]|uniref:GEVED domain-containing protein n=1 Tax=Soonwooa sp. TaxID=1938592 RepID=UPI0028AF9770|nr:GEVED domain-containing protein [Soonwooa sp.]
MLSLGTTPGDDDILSESVNTNYFNVGEKKTLLADTKIYAQLISVNNVGSTPSCEVMYFTTGANQVAAYFGPLIEEATYPITIVNFAGINNSSNASINVDEDHKFFLDTQAKVKKWTTYPITLIGTGEGANRFGYTVYIAWNQNGSFLDAGEAYFKTSDFAGGSGATVTVNKNIAIPATAKLGDTRMRVKYNFNASATETGDELSPCLDMTYGQTEYYTLTVINDLATNEANKTFAIVYPNLSLTFLKFLMLKMLRLS